MLSPIVLTAGVLFVVLSLIILFRSGRFWKSLAFTALTGNGALLGVGYLAAFTGTMLAVNWFTIAVATISGIPGVIGMLLLKLLFHA